MFNLKLNEFQLKSIIKHIKTQSKDVKKMFANTIKIQNFEMLHSRECEENTRFQWIGGITLWLFMDYFFDQNIYILKSIQII